MVVLRFVRRAGERAVARVPNRPALIAVRGAGWRRSSSARPGRAGRTGPTRTGRGLRKQRQRSPRSRRRSVRPPIQRWACSSERPAGSATGTRRRPAPGFGVIDQLGVVRVLDQKAVGPAVTVVPAGIGGLQPGRAENLPLRGWGIGGRLWFGRRGRAGGRGIAGGRRWGVAEKEVCDLNPNFPGS